jgi:flavin reductase
MALVSPEEFVAAMRHVAASVSVVTSADFDGAGRAGATVSAMCSVSAEPPSLLVCLNHGGHFARRVKENRAFCVNVLAADQTDVANCFAGRTEASREDRFRCGRWTTLSTGCPVLDGAQAVFDCEVLVDQTVGTHTIVIGRVASVLVTPTTPLLYLDREYRNLPPGSAVSITTSAA